MMPPPMRSVFSSHVDRIGHDMQTGELHVVWDSGKTSVYSGVPADVADDVSQSWSVGSALTAKVKGKYAHRYLESGDD
jgi:hypothetical protein